MDLNSLSKNLVESAINFTRFGLSAAGSAVGYAAELLKDVESLDSVRAARAAGLTVEIGVPSYEQPTWRGYVPGNPQIYAGWMTPEDHVVLPGGEDWTERAAASTKARTAAEETPCASGLLRGRSAPTLIEPLKATSTMVQNAFMFVTSER